MTGEDGYTLLTLSELGNLSGQDPTEAILPVADARIDRAAAMLASLSATGYDTAAIFGIGVKTERREAMREAGKALRTADRSDARDALAMFVRARSRIILAAGGDRAHLADAIAGLGSISDDVPAVVTLNLAIALVMRDGGGDRSRAGRLLGERGGAGAWEDGAPCAGQGGGGGDSRRPDEGEMAEALERDIAAAGRSAAAGC